MKSCDDCPSSTNCSGHNLEPVLVRVFDLYQGGTTDKFDILFALSDADEDILERYSANVSHACWSKAALLAIVNVAGRIAGEGLAPAVAVERLRQTIETALKAFARFPWKIDELVEQSGDLYGLIQERCPDATLCDALSKRAFVKMCKDIAYGSG